MVLVVENVGSIYACSEMAHVWLLRDIAAEGSVRKDHSFWLTKHISLLRYVYSLKRQEFAGYGKAQNPQWHQLPSKFVKQTD